MHKNRRDEENNDGKAHSWKVPLDLFRYSQCHYLAVGFAQAQAEQIGSWPSSGQFQCHVLEASIQTSGGAEQPTESTQVQIQSRSKSL